MIRRGIATNETIGEVLKKAGTPLTYDATPEAWRKAFTTISGSDKTITPRETENVIGWKSTDETASKVFSKASATSDDDKGTTEGEDTVKNVSEETTEPVVSKDKTEDNKEEGEELTAGDQTAEGETSEENTLEDETVEGDKEPETGKNRTIADLLKGKKNTKRK